LYNYESVTQTEGQISWGIQEINIGNKKKTETKAIREKPVVEIPKLCPDNKLN